MSHSLGSNLGRHLSGQLEVKQVRKFARIVEEYSGLDLTEFLDSKLLTLRWYSRSYEKRHHESPLAFSRRWEKSIYLETPMVEHVAKDCLAFVILHEFGHLVEGTREKDATSFAIRLLKRRSVLSRERVEVINRGWRKARRNPSVVKRERLFREFIHDAYANDDDFYDMAVISILDRPDIAMTTRASENRIKADGEASRT